MNNLQDVIVAQKLLEEQYPKMFASKYGGLDISAGWVTLIQCLCAYIQSHVDWKQQTDPEFPQVVVEQIKEKFGTLRFYYSGGDDYIAGLVAMAEAMSGYICEECGAAGKTQGKGWLKTTCEAHTKHDE